MINALRLVNFKNFADVTLRMGPFTVVVGANASGKSNLRDAFRFLHGIGRGYTLPDVIGGKYGAGGQVEWEQIRGTAREVVRFGQSRFTLSFRMALNDTEVRYVIRIRMDKAGSGAFRVVAEQLKVDESLIYTSHPGSDDPVQAQEDDNHLLLRMAKTGTQKKLGLRIAVRPDQPALTQVHEHSRVVRLHKKLASQVAQALAGMRFLDLSPDRMRQPAFPGQTVLGDSGENLPTVLKEICANERHKKTLAEWTRALTPMDVHDFEFPTDPTTGHVQLVFCERNGNRVSAHSASDGTLRFIAMLAALLGTNPARLYVFEEIDNGIHPSRQQLLIDLIEAQTAKGNLQVVTTTHSPDLIELVGPGTFENTSVVCRLPDTDAAEIRPVAALPNAGKLRQSQGLGRLHRSGWMENAVLFDRSRSERELNVLIIPENASLVPTAPSPSRY